jgi:hypothetical protein
MRSSVQDKRLEKKELMRFHQRLGRVWRPNPYGWVGFGDQTPTVGSGLETKPLRLGRVWRPNPYGWVGFGDQTPTVGSGLETKPLRLGRVWRPNPYGWVGFGDQTPTVGSGLETKPLRGKLPLPHFCTILLNGINHLLLQISIDLDKGGLIVRKTE